MNATSGGQQQGLEGLTSAQHEALDAWAVERGMEISELQMLKDELAHSSNRRAEVFGTAGSAEIVEEKGVIGKTIDFFRNNIKEVLIGLGIMGGAIGVYVGKQMLDAAMKTAEETVDIANKQLDKNLEERWEEIEAFARESFELAKTLAAEMLNFIVALQEELTDFEGAQTLVVELWKGFKEDGRELIEEKDIWSDSILKRLTAMVANNPELKPRLTKIEVLVRQLKQIPDELGALKESVIDTEGLQKDFTEATWDRFEENFKTELFQPFQKGSDLSKAA